jgi:hypothetical protein
MIDVYSFFIGVYTGAVFVWVVGCLIFLDRKFKKDGGD